MLIRTSERREAFRREATAAHVAFAKRDTEAAYHHLERAHILGQPWAAAHSWSHWMMLRLALRQRDWKEASGQLLRLAAGGVLSLIGWLPSGNTGRANVSAVRPMPLPADLKALCEALRGKP